MFNKIISKKTVAAALTLSILTNAFGNTSIGTSYQAEAKPSVSTSENKLFKFIKNHTVLTTVSATAALISVCAGATILALIPKNKTEKTNHNGTNSHTNDLNTDTAIPKRKPQKTNHKDTNSHTNDSNTDTTTPSEEPQKTVSTILDGMTKEQTLLYRNQQIEKFKKIGNGVFEVDETFVNDLSLKAVALIIRELNEIFETYPNITRSFIAFHKEYDTKFVVNSENIKGVTAAQTNFFTITFNSYKHKTARKMWLSNKRDVDSGFHSPVDDIKLVEADAAHEMGHLISYILMCAQIKNYENYYAKVLKEYITHQYKGEKEITFGNKSPQLIKKDIIEIARSQFNYKGNCHISEYGASNDKEWIAEVCAHALCSEKPNTLGLAFLKFLDEQENALSGPCLPKDEYYSQWGLEKIA